MEIKTKYNIGDMIYYLERKRIAEQCPTCEGAGRINVTKGVLGWNIKCPDCNGKKKLHQVIHYDVVSGIIRGITTKSVNQSTIKYILKNGMHKNESALFVTMEEAEAHCRELNEQIEQANDDI